MTNAKIEVNCDGVLCDSSLKFDVPNWVSRLGNSTVEYGGDSSYVFCDRPECQKQSEWFDKQCPGCVEGFSQCALGKSFQYSYHRTITPEQIQVIRTGKCPFRTNGTFSVFVDKKGMGEFSPQDLSEQATTESGNAVADAIIEYVTKYPTEAVR